MYNPYEPWIQSLRLGPRSYPQLDPPPSKGAVFMADYMPRARAARIAWMDNWVAVVGAAPTSFGTTAGVVTGIGTKVTTLKTASALVVSLKDQLKAAVQAEAAADTDATESLRALGRGIIASTTVTNSNKITAGYKVRDTTPTARTVVPPTGLAAEGFSNGTTVLKWNRAGNPAGCDFNIEGQFGTSTAWVLVGHTGKTNFRHTGQTPGVKAIYRVRAQVGDLISEPSNEASVYGS